MIGRIMHEIGIFDLPLMRLNGVQCVYRNHFKDIVMDVQIVTLKRNGRNVVAHLYPPVFAAPQS